MVVPIADGLSSTLPFLAVAAGEITIPGCPARPCILLDQLVHRVISVASSPALSVDGLDAVAGGVIRILPSGDGFPRTIAVGNSGGTVRSIVCPSTLHSIR